MGLMDKLSYLLETKNAIREAIINKEVDVPENATFFSYGDYIRRIRGYGKKEKINARNDNLTRTNTGDSSYTSPSSSASRADSTTGENKDIVDLVVGDSDNHKTFTGASEGHDGFGTVTVQVNMYPKEWKPYTVKFWASNSFSGTPLYEDTNVPPHGTARFEGDYPTQNGKIFKGWSPSIENVTSDLNVVAQFGNASEVSYEEISDDWATICANGGAPYPIGSYKILPVSDFTASFTAIDPYGVETLCEHVNSAGSNGEHFNFIMTKVAEGEDGTTSTWLCYKDPWHDYGSINAANYLMVRGGSFENKIFWKNNWTDSSKSDNEIIQNKVMSSNCWYESRCREFLNYAFIDAFPAEVRAAIRPVRKHHTGILKSSRGFDNCDAEGHVWYRDMETYDRVWIPSLREIFGKDFSNQVVNSDGTKWTVDHYHNAAYYGMGGDIYNYVETEGMTYAVNPYNFLDHIYRVPNSRFRSGAHPVNSYNHDVSSGGVAVFIDENHPENWGRLGYDIVFGFCLSPTTGSAPVQDELTTAQIEQELRSLGAGGNVDLLNRPKVPASSMTGWNMSSGYATVNSVGYTNSENKTFNFTPIVANGRNLVRVMTPEELDTYANAVIENEQQDSSNCQIGGSHDTVDSANTDAQRIHELHEMLLNRGYFD